MHFWQILAMPFCSLEDIWIQITHCSVETHLVKHQVSTHICNCCNQYLKLKQCYSLHHTVAE